MPDKDEVFALPTKEEKLDYVLTSVSGLMELFEIDDMHIENQDPINFTVKFPVTDKRLEAFKTLEGFDLNESPFATVRHKFDDKTAVSTNICVDKTRGSFILSMNY